MGEVKRRFVREGKHDYIVETKPDFYAWLEERGTRKDFEELPPKEQRKVILLYAYGGSDEANENFYFAEKEVIEQYRGMDSDFCRMRVAWYDYIRSLLGEGKQPQEVQKVLDEFGGEVVR